MSRQEDCRSQGKYSPSLTRKAATPFLGSAPARTSITQGLIPAAVWPALRGTRGAETSPHCGSLPLSHAWLMAPVQATAVLQWALSQPLPVQARAS